MAKRMLVIGDADGLWTKRYIEHVPLKAGYEVVVFPIWGCKGKYAAFYRENGVTVYSDEHKLPVIRRIPRVRMWARILANAKSLRALGPFDVVQNHYLSQRDLALGWQMAKAFKARWACCFWGSDLLRATPAQLKQMRPYLEKCDWIHADYGGLVEHLEKVYGPELALKGRVVDFGHVGYACIDQVRAQADKARCKAHFGLEPDSFVLHVGYSASAAQQQLKVLQQISTLPQEVLDRITVVVQQTYCMDDPAYAQQVRDYVAEMPCKTLVLTEFMDDMQTAWLRLSADLFILAITTDAFCATLSEYLYAGAVVVRGDWLVYQQLIAMGITLPTFHEWQEIPGIVLGGMEGTLKPLSEEDRARFPALYSWDAVRPEWLKLYE